MSLYKLTYFCGRGRGEPIRYLLAISGAPYEDIRIPNEKWPELKKLTPMGGLPLLEVDGKMLCQSMAIARYLSKQLGFRPADDWDAARVDMLVDGVVDLKVNLQPMHQAIFAGNQEKKVELWNSFKSDALQTFLNRYENYLKQSGTGFFVGNKITFADIIVAETLNRFTTLFDSPSILSGHENLLALMNKVHDLPNLQKYIATRPDTVF